MEELNAGRDSIDCKFVLVLYQVVGVMYTYDEPKDVQYQVRSLSSNRSQISKLLLEYMRSIVRSI